MGFPLRTVLAVLLVLANAPLVPGQVARADLRLSGRVLDEAGKPLEGAKVTLLTEKADSREAVTARRGAWAIAGVPAGEARLRVARDGYEPRLLTVVVLPSGGTQVPDVRLRKQTAAEQGAAIAGAIERAQGFVTEKRFAEAREVYAELLARYPHATHVDLEIARAYHLEGAHDQEIAHFRRYLEKNPSDARAKLLASGEMIGRGDAAEGRALFATVDWSLVKDAGVLLDTGIVLLNQDKASDALVFFDKAIAHFPEVPDPYYYRGVAALQMVSELGPEHKAEIDRLTAAGRADLSKFVEMAPNALEAPLARKMLERLK